MQDTLVLNNRYRIDERQATGGMATVYRATDLMLERAVAIKILRTDLSNDVEFRDRFRQEAKAAAKLSHPNIVTVHDFGLDQDQIFIVMEYVPGIDLKTILKNRHRLPTKEALALILQACSGIGYAHRAGFVHCDIKPQNMLVTADGRLKVVDFGIARAFASISPDEKAEIVWGSPQYFSPEQASGLPPSPATDVYSLGIVLFELLTGQLPFNGTTPDELARQHREAPPPSPSKLNPEISPDLEQVILKVLSKDPSARYRTAGQLEHVLATLPNQPIAQAAVASQRILDPGMLPVQEYTIQAQSIPAEPSSPQATPTTIQKDNSQPARTIYSTKIKQPARPGGVDWVTWLLVLFTIIALGGLIPFWLWVYTILNPPI